MLGQAACKLLLLTHAFDTLRCIRPPLRKSVMGLLGRGMKRLRGRARARTYFFVQTSVPIFVPPA